MTLPKEWRLCSARPPEFSGFRIFFFKTDLRFFWGQDRLQKEDRNLAEAKVFKVLLGGVVVGSLPRIKGSG